MKGRFGLDGGWPSRLDNKYRNYISEAFEELVGDMKIQQNVVPPFRPGKAAS